ncbi:MAG: carbamate kinase [Treponema sp.]|jgi:carbamate kinase|nr:carbamate kinase [Treponema sp.]
MKKRIVIALGGNALGDNLREQMMAVKGTARAIADLIEDGHDVVISHGNGPQVGMIKRALEAGEKSEAHTPFIPLSVCVAMSQGYIGYDLQNSLREELLNRGIDRGVVSIISQTIVDENDPAFQNPGKPIGGFVTGEEAKRLEREAGYVMKEDSGRGWRRMAASPMPVDIVEKDVVKALLNEGQIVVASGGGGIPVIVQGNHLKGAAAVVDKDFASCLLARLVDADTLIILTAVEKVSINFRRENERQLDRMTVDEAEEYIRQGHFAPGSMLPKVEAAALFARSKPGRVSLITLLEKARDGIQGKTGTIIFTPN